MIRAIILCCDEQNRRRMSLKDVPGHAVDACSNTLVSSGHNGGTGGPEPGHQGGQHGLQHQRRQSHDPSVDRSYGDGLNCGYMQER